MTMKKIVMPEVTRYVHVNDTISTHDHWCFLNTTTPVNNRRIPSLTMQSRNSGKHVSWSCTDGLS